MTLIQHGSSGILIKERMYVCASVYLVYLSLSYIYLSICVYIVLCHKSVFYLC